MKIQYQDTKLTVFESALYRTTSSVLVTDDFVLLLDPNWLPIEIDCIKNHIEKIKGERPLYLLFTHSDYDHIIGYEAFGGATVIASKAFQENPKKEKILSEIQDFDDEYYIQRNYPISYPKVDIEIEADGQTLQIGATSLTFFLAEGHTNDGIFTLIDGYFFAGDYWSNIEFPYIYHSGKAYLETIQKFKQILLDFPIRLLVPGHGDCTDSLQAIEQRIQDSESYILELISTISKPSSFPLDMFLEQYAFPKIMRKFHEGNVELLKKEFG